MITTLIVITVLLLISLGSNYVFYKRLIDFEDQNQERESLISQKIEGFKKTLENRAKIIEEVAGLEVVSNEPFVKRVVQTIIEAHEEFSELQVQLDHFELELDEKEDEEE